MAREVKTERFSRTEGKTPAFEGEVQKTFGRLTPSPRNPCPHFRPDGRRRESEGRGLLSNRETITDPVQRKRRKGKGDPGSRNAVVPNDA